MDVKLEKTDKWIFSEYETKVITNSINCLHRWNCSYATKSRNLNELRQIHRKCQFKRNLAEVEYIKQQLQMCRKLDSLYAEETRKCCEEIKQIKNMDTGPILIKEEINIPCDEQHFETGQTLIKEERCLPSVEQHVDDLEELHDPVVGIKREADDDDVIRDVNENLVNSECLDDIEEDFLLMSDASPELKSSNPCDLDIPEDCKEDKGCNDKYLILSVAIILIFAVIAICFTSRNVRQCYGECFGRLNSCVSCQFHKLMSKVKTEIDAAKLNMKLPTITEWKQNFCKSCTWNQYGSMEEFISEETAENNLEISVSPLSGSIESGIAGNQTLHYEGHLMHLRFLNTIRNFIAPLFQIKQNVSSN